VVLAKIGKVMATCICWACKTTFESARSSKLCCSDECRKMYQSDYDHDRYIEFRNVNRKKKRDMLAIKYSIISSNLYKIASVCDECLTKFYYDYTIFQKFNDVYVSSYNTTQWGAAYCPNCGLVERSQCDEIFIPASGMDQIERKLFLSEIHKTKRLPIRHEAIYIRNQLDFIAEAEDVRRKLNQIYDRGALTQAEINICIAALFKRIGESK
jgi:hypothetical protein